MNTLELDRLLKENYSIKRTHVPMMVEERFEQTLQGLPLPAVIKRKRVYRRLTLFAASLLILLAGFILSVRESPQVSIEMQKVPVVGAGIAKISDFREWSVSDQGITMNVDRIQDDGRVISADLSFHSSTNIDQEMINYLLRMDQKLVSGSGGAFIRTTGKNSFQATITESILGSHQDSQDSYEFKLYVTQIGDKRGKWYISVPVVKDNTPIIFIKPNQEKASDDISIKLNEVRVSPLSTEINIGYVKKQNPEVRWGYELVDESGGVETSVGSINYYMQYEIQGQNGNESHLFGPINSNSKNIQIIPFTFEPNTSPFQPYKIKLKSMPSESQPVSLNQGASGRILVTGIEFMEKRTLVHVRIEGSNPVDQINRIYLENKYGKALYSLSRTQIRLDQKDYTLEFPTTSPEITLVAFPTYALKMRPDLEFNVDVVGVKESMN